MIHHTHIPPMKELLKRYAWVQRMNRLHHCPERFYPKKKPKKEGRHDHRP